MSVRHVAATVGIFTFLMTVSPGSVQAEPIPLDGRWTILDQFAAAPFFFSGGPWTWTSPNPVRFDITDVFVVSDAYRVFDHGALKAIVSGQPDWTAIGGACGAPHSRECHWTGDPDVAWADTLFNKASLLFGSGSHAITLEDIHVPPVARGANPFVDGTVAFRASESPVPEPTSLLLLGSGLAAMVVRRRVARLHR
jgi:hypothetical protein